MFLLHFHRPRHRHDTYNCWNSRYLKAGSFELNDLAEKISYDFRKKFEGPGHKLFDSGGLGFIYESQKLSLVEVWRSISSLFNTFQTR